MALAEMKCVRGYNMHFDRMGECLVELT